MDLSEDEVRMEGQQLPGDFSTPFSRHYQQDVQVWASGDHGFCPQTAQGHLHRSEKSGM